MTLRDAIYGLAIGDALGVPYEFRDRDNFKAKEMVGYGTHDQPAGTWSDDTSLTLATCASILRCDGIDLFDIRKKFVSWLSEGEYSIDGTFDMGVATVKALNQGFGCDGEYDNGNGSLMRIIPLAFLEVSDDDISLISAITHAHEISIDACIIFVRYAQDLISCRDPVEALKNIKNQGKFEKLNTINQLSRNDISSSGYVVHTLEAALWCLTTTSSYKDCVLTAVNLGNDTDTTAAVAGALAGIVYGFEGIPTKWIKTLRGKDIIENCLF